MRRIEKRKIRRIVYSWPVVLVLLGILVLFAMSTWDVFMKYQKSTANVTRLEEDYTTLVEREKKLQERIEYLQSEQGIEEEIRDKFNVAKEGEQVIVIVDPEVAEDEENAEPEGFWDKVWGSITGLFQ